MGDHGGGADKETDEDGDILPRFKGLPNIVEGVDDIFSHLKKRHVHLYPENGTHKKWVQPQIIVLFATGNLSQVVDTVIRDLKHPFGVGLVTSVLVQEPLRQAIVRRLRNRMELMDERIETHPNFLNTLKVIERLNCRTLFMEEYDPVDKRPNGVRQPHSPIVVLDFPQIYFGDKPTAIVTLNTFRTLSEAIKLCNREGLQFDTISIWTNKLSEGYDMVPALSKYPNFRFNCINVPFDSKVMVAVHRNYHYEVLANGGDLSTIVFPIRHHIH
ncbi:PREDICTED: uncharacterized protein LOC108619037 [Drosophila arizonae]|uniref:Uncharacterized protein LOC108619037 n=1 Tax=Drosophila arizonae TaxID=7263 RepID=A0ABM1PUC7_DROAR|nr:PREDICTED: uncharacterized protein LOC108619037 [Drosophila arizonae]